MTIPFDDLDDLSTLADDLASAWRDKANCRTADPDIFFDEEEPRSVQRENARKVREICAGCPVIAECASFGVRQQAGRWASYRPKSLQGMRTGERRGWDDLMAGRLPKRANSKQGDDAQ